MLYISWKAPGTERKGEKAGGASCLSEKVGGLSESGGWD